MTHENDAGLISATIIELGYHSLENLIEIGRKSPSTVHLVIEKILQKRSQDILLIDSQTNCEEQAKRLFELDEKQFHKPSFINGWNESLGILKEKWLKTI